MRDLQHPGWMWLKAVLFLAESPHGRTALFLALAIWAFCRAYYFAFYVIQHYIDPGFRYAGLGALLVHLVKRR